MTRALFEPGGCTVTEIKSRSDGKAKWSRSIYPDPITINVAYRCTDARGKPVVFENQQIELYCPENEFTLHQSGDHCNSFGMCERFSTSPNDHATPSEPRRITDADQTATALCRAWCKPAFVFPGLQQEQEPECDAH